MAERFVSEAIEPVDGTFDAARMATGEPGLPGRFRWRAEEYAVEEVIDRWKDSGPCRNGAAEIYLRKHWYHVRTSDGSEMKLYFERQPRGAGEAAKHRWWLYTIISRATSNTESAT